MGVVSSLPVLRPLPDFVRLLSAVDVILRVKKLVIHRVAGFVQCGGHI